jgi:hypothetical protein
MAGDGDKNGNGPNLVTVVAAVATAIGTLGWVAFIGGAFLWISFSRAHLPAAEAVAKVPTGVLVATGAEFVVWAALAALVTIVVLYLLDDRVQRLQTKARLAERERLTEELRENEEREKRWADNVKRATSEDERQRANEGLEAAQQAVKTTHESLVSESASTFKGPFLRGLLPAILVGGTALFFAFKIDLGYGHIPWFWGVFWVIVAAILAGVMGSMLYRRTARFSVIGVFALLAVPLVMAIATYFRAQAAPRVEPVAFLRSDGSPFVGFFIAQTPDRVYVGTYDVETNPCKLLHRTTCENQLPRITEPARLLSLPTSDVQNLTIGPRKPLNAQDAEFDSNGPRTAREWAGSAALRLCDDAVAARQTAIANIPSDPTSSTKPLPQICSKDDEQSLRDFYEEEQNTVDQEAQKRG